ncbi:MAG: hypothetical protein LQ350_006565 [Teloschistes chrysophthalmus]|nr:MAG: hypothetical protein LQ350_006565 [Niorma chrysophthalma]
MAAQKKPSNNGPPSPSHGGGGGTGGGTDKDPNVGRNPANQNNLHLLAETALALASSITPQNDSHVPGSDALPGIPTYSGWLPQSVNTQRNAVTESQNAHFQSSLPSNSSNSSRPTMPGSTSNAAMPQGTSTYKGVNHHRAEQARPKTPVPKKSRYTPLSSRSDRGKVKKPEQRRPTNTGQQAHRQLLTPLRHMGLGSSRNAEASSSGFDRSMDTSVKPLRQIRPKPSRYSGPGAEAFSSGFDHLMDTSETPLEQMGFGGSSRDTRFNAEAFPIMDTSVTPLRQMGLGTNGYTQSNTETGAASSAIGHSTNTSVMAGVNHAAMDTSEMDDYMWADWLQEHGDVTTAMAGPVIDPDLMNMDPNSTYRASSPNGSDGNTPEPFMDYNIDRSVHHPEASGNTPPIAMDDDDMETHTDTNATQMATTHNESSTPRTAKMGRIPKRKPAAGPKDTSHLRDRPFAPKLDTRARKKGPTVEKVRVNNRFGPRHERAVLETQRKANQAGVLVQRCLEAAAIDADVDKLMQDLRDELHSLEHSDVMIEPEVRNRSKIMDEAFPTIFANHIFPWDIKSDAQVLFNRYEQGDADPHLFRGISTRKPREDGHKKSQVSHTIEKDYPYGARAAVVGAGKLQNGQWWPRQICAVRDGAHGALVDGIFGASGQGAYSVVMSGTGYSDVDEGDVVKYCGTSGHADGPTRSTRRMMESRTSGNPVRVLRSHKLHSTFRPSVGLRYDGLYRVIDSELLDQGTSMWRFTLERIEGQTPIRYQGAAARPTGWDKTECGRL